MKRILVIASLLFSVSTFAQHRALIEKDTTGIVATRHKLRADSSTLRDLINTVTGWGNHAGLYPLLSGSYTNPTWLTSIPNTKVTYTGTTSQYVRGNGSIVSFPTIPAQFAPVAGTNVTLSGTYPNITFNATVPAQFAPVAGTNVTLSGTYPNITFNATGDGNAFVDGGLYNATTRILSVTRNGTTAVVIDTLPLATPTEAGLLSPADKASLDKNVNINNVGTGNRVAVSVNDSTLNLKTFKAGTNITIDTTATEITINSTASGGTGEANTGQNLGTGIGVYSAKSGTALQFNSIKAGTGISVALANNEITVTNTGEGSGGGGGISTTFTPGGRNYQSVAHFLFSPFSGNPDIAVAAGGGTGGTFGDASNWDTPSQLPANCNCVGVARGSTGTTATGYALLGQTAKANWLRLAGTKGFRFAAKLFVDNLRDAAQEYRLIVGFQDGSANGNDPQDGAFFRYSSASANWELVNRADYANTTVVNSGVEVVAGTVYTLEVEYDGAGGVNYYINGSKIGSTVSTNVPSAAGRETSYGISFTKTAGTTARTINVDWVAFGIDF